jgi:hypothetical protein
MFTQKTQRFFYIGFICIESKRPSTTPNFLSRSAVYESDHNQAIRKAGINLTFPGETEFMERYKKPEELPYSPFVINPQPDFTLTGRPLARLIPDSFQSEYTRRYVYFIFHTILFFILFL